MTRVYLDMDGVLADFNEGLRQRGVTHHKSQRLMQGFLDKSDWTQDELDFDNAVQECMATPGFFRNLPRMIGSHRLWELAGKNSVVLTARPKVEDAAHRVYHEKLNFIREHFENIPEDRFVCCLRSEKKHYAAHFEGPMLAPLMRKIRNILVDDLEWNCSEWEKAGGIAVLFRNMDQACNDLEKLLVD